MTEQNCHKEPLIIVVMGVSGCGKSTIANELAGLLGAHFKDGDELHPASNIEKMRTGIPLTDKDREPWLLDVAAYSKQQAKKYGACIVACSALKNRYRQILNQAGNVAYVFLHGSPELIAAGIHTRAGHFMPETLLSSQFAALEDPRKEANVVEVNIDSTISNIAKGAAKKLKQHGIWPTDDIEISQ